MRGVSPLEPKSASNLANLQQFQSTPTTRRDIFGLKSNLGKTTKLSVYSQTINTVIEIP